MGLTSASELAAAVTVLADDGHRLLQPLGHVVEGAGQLLHLRRRVGRVPRTRASRWPSASSRDVTVRRRRGRASHCASSSAVMSATTSATSAALRRTSVMVRVVWSRDVKGLLSVTVSSRLGGRRSEYHRSRTVAAGTWPTGVGSRFWPGSPASSGRATSTSSTRRPPGSRAPARRGRRLARSPLGQSRTAPELGVTQGPRGRAARPAVRGQDEWASAPASDFVASSSAMSVATDFARASAGWSAPGRGRSPPAGAAARRARAPGPRPPPG